MTNATDHFKSWHTIKLKVTTSIPWSGESFNFLDPSWSIDCSTQWTLAAKVVSPEFVVTGQRPKCAPVLLSEDCVPKGGAIWGQATGGAVTKITASPFLTRIRKRSP